MASGIIIQPDAVHSFDCRGAFGAMLFVDPESSEGVWLRAPLTEDITTCPESLLEAPVSDLRAFTEIPIAYRPSTMDPSPKNPDRKELGPTEKRTASQKQPAPTPEPSASQSPMAHHSAKSDEIRYHQLPLGRRTPRSAVDPLIDHPDPHNPAPPKDPGAVIRRCAQALSPGAPPHRHLDARVTTVLHRIQTSEDLRISLEAAAALAFLSPSRFAHLFRQQVGLPFSRYMLWRKLTRAMLAIGSERTIADAAQAADFADAAHLTRTFNQMVGMAPSVLMRGAFKEIPSPFSVTPH